MIDNELITVRQLPVIEEQLQMIRAGIESRVAEALSMVCTEETRVEVKKIRAELKKEFEELEIRRRAVKSAIMAPYEQFEAVYKRCAADLYKDADRQLAQRIAAVETGIKDQMCEENREFFEEYRTSQGIPADLVTYSQAGIKVTLSASMKSLNAQVVQFIDRVKGDLALINTMEHQEEIMVEYRKTLSVVTAVQTVKRRHAEIEHQRQAMAARQAAEQQRKATEQAITAICADDVDSGPPAAPPTILKPPADEAIADPDEIKYHCRFEVRATMPMLKALKQFLTDGGYEYVSK